jgi:hypothetical protein
LTLRQLVPRSFCFSALKAFLCVKLVVVFRAVYGYEPFDQGAWYALSTQAIESYFLHLQGANYVRTELAVRIAHRLRDLQALPYVVVTQEGVAKVYEVRLPLVSLCSHLRIF